MNEEIKEILEGIKVVIKHNGTLEFDTKELKTLLNYITNLQSNWNSLKEYIKEIPEEEFVNTEWYVNILDKMNELESEATNE